MASQHIPRPATLAHLGGRPESADLRASDVKTEVLLQSQLNELGLVELQCVAVDSAKGVP